MNPIAKAWRWFTLADHHEAASTSMLPAVHSTWVSAHIENGYESYSACCGEHLLLWLESFRKTVKEKSEDE